MKALIELHSELVAFHGYPVQVEVAIAAWHPRKEQIMLNRRSDTSLALYRTPGRRTNPGRRLGSRVQLLPRISGEPSPTPETSMPHFDQALTILRDRATRLFA